FTAQSGTVTFNSTNTSFDIDVPITDDSVIEPQEAFTVVLSNVQSNIAVGILGGDTANGTINDDDANGPTEGIAVSDFTVNEDDSTAQFIVSYTGNTVQDAFNVNFSVSDNTAIDPDDYTVANTDTFVTFPAGTATGGTQLVTINIVDDMVIEATETLDIALAFDATPPAGINMLDDQGVGTINDDDANGPTEGIAEGDFTVNEDAGTAEFIVSYTGNTVQDAFNVNFNVTDNTAVDPNDYTVTTANGVLVFPANTSSGDAQTIIVTIIEDELSEMAETLNIALAFDATPPAGINMLDDQGVGTILDNDINASPYEEEITIICGNPIPDVPQLTFMGGCGDYDVVFSEERQDAVDSDDYMIVRTWEVTDSCGNTATFEQFIFVLQPQLEEVFIDICVEDEPIDLITFLPGGFDTNGTFEVLEGNLTLNGSIFDPSGIEIGAYKIAYSSIEGDCKYFVDFNITTNSECVPCNRSEIEVNDAITVNGDGINDFLEITGAEYCTFQFDIMVFNRWGDKVFEQNNYQNDWGGIAPNGSFGNSGVLPSGTYYYIITIRDVETGSNIEPLNGYIYLGTK
ncbi:MAG: Calx-beta domain-containing protein, partial [Croceivirga sp.]